MGDEGGKPSHRFIEILQQIFAYPWILAGLLTIFGVLSVYIGVDTPSSRKLGAGGVFGAAIGVAYIVEVRCFVAEIIRRLICAFIGALAGGVICLLMELSTGHALIGVAVGMVLGVTSNRWIDHINLP